MPITVHETVTCDTCGKQVVSLPEHWFLIDFMHERASSDPRYDTNDIQMPVWHISLTHTDHHPPFKNENDHWEYFCSMTCAVRRIRKAFKPKRKRRGVSAHARAMYKAAFGKKKATATESSKPS